MVMKHHPELDGVTIKELGLLHYDYSKMYAIEQYGVNMSDYWHSLLVKYIPYSIYLSIAYVAFIYLGQLYMKNRPAFGLRVPMTIWSLVLAVFSIIGTFRSGNVLYYITRDYGFMYSVCHPHFYYNSNAFWGFLFIISKPIELGDTVFIVLRKQPLIFLHWYHHVTVMLYVFVSFYEHSSCGLYFYVINYGVHALMYTYYTLKACRVWMPRFVPMCVTSIQLSQMLLGSAVLTYVLVLRRLHGGICQITDRLLYLGLAMYLSYFLLFGHFFYQAYFRGRFWARVRSISKSAAPPLTSANGDVANGNLVANGNESSIPVANGHTKKHA